MLTLLSLSQLQQITPHTTFTSPIFLKLIPHIAYMQCAECLQLARVIDIVTGQWNRNWGGWGGGGGGPGPPNYLAT